MGRYFRAQAWWPRWVCVLFAVGFGLTSCPWAFARMIICLLNMVPYLQSRASARFFLGAVHALETGTNLWTVMLLILAVFAVVQLIQDAVLVPRIMGDATGLSPAFILLSLSVWGKLLGMLGLLVAIPMTCLCWAWYQRLVTGEGGPRPAP
jgi:predicted PurR-regulated permease PerM